MKTACENEVVVKHMCKASEGRDCDFNKRSLYSYCTHRVDNGPNIGQCTNKDAWPENQKEDEK